MEKAIEPTLFDFTEEEQNLINTKKDSLEQIEIKFSEKTDWKDENGEEITLFLRDRKLVSQNVIYTGLSKNYDNHGHYNNTDKSIHWFFIGNERRRYPMLLAIAHPNEEHIKNLTDDECEEFNFIMRNINPEYKKAYKDKLEQERLEREANAGKNATNYILKKLNAAGIEVVTDKEEFENRLDEINGTDIFQAMTERFSEADKLKQDQTEENSVPRATKEIRESIEYVLEKVAIPLTEVDYTRENYQQIFRDGIIQSPVETIKMSPNQFVRLCPPDRNNLMGAIYETMTKPSLVIEKETFDEKSERFKPVHVYGKSFINEKNNHTRAVECLIIFRDGENIATSLHNRGITKVISQIKTADDIIYLDNEVSRVTAFSIKAGDSHVVKETEKFLSSSGRKSLPSWNKFYNPEEILSIKKLIEDGKVKDGNLEITKENFDRYFNIFNQNTKVYKDKSNKIASDLFNYHVKPENKAEMKKWLENQGYKIIEKIQQFKFSNGKVYGFAYDGKIYLNPDFLNSNVAVHEYTHLWDEYTRRTNPELWQKGMDILKDTKLFAEVKSDPNYADIAGDDNLVLSEVHARICGKLAQKYLERIAREDGEIKSISASEWNKEVAEYVEKELFPDREIFHQRYHTRRIKENELDGDAIERFLATPMIDLAKGLSVKHRDFETRFENGDFTEAFERLSDINFKTNIYKTMQQEEQKKEYEKLWSELFLDGESKEIQEKREGWQQRIKEYEDELKLPETLEKTKAAAKRFPTEIIKERLGQYKKNEHGFYPKTAEEAAERNEAKFKDDILNRLGKQYDSYDHWLNWNNVYVGNYTEPVSNIATDIRISVLENELKERGISIEKEKLMTKEEIVDYYVEHNNDRKTGRFHSYASMMIDWKDFVENLYMSDAITQKQRDALTEPCTEKDFKKFNERFESNVKQKATKEQENDYDETTEIEKLYAEVNPNGGNDRGFQFGVKDLDHLRNIKNLLDDFEKNPPKHSELEDFEAKEKRYQKESKRLQKIYEKENDKDALKGAQKNADYANFYHWQVEKLTKDIIQHPDKFDKVKTWYEKAYPTDKKMVEKMSEYIVFGQLESDIESGIGYGQPNASSERYGEYDSIVRERLFEKLAEINNIDYDVIYDKWLHACEEKNQNLNKESSQKNDVYNSQKMSKPMPLDFGHKEKEISNAPFEIIKDERFNRVNIRFDTENKGLHFDEILRELKSNEWKYAPSKKQWYPTNLKNNPDEFAKKLLEKYSESKEKQEIKNEYLKVAKENDFAEKLSENKNSPYDGIKFFDRNYLETEDFTAYFNKHIDSFGNKKPLLSENDAKYILRALNHLDVGLLEERTDRLGIDNKGQLVIFSKQKDVINITRTDLKGVIKTAKEMSEKSLKQAEEAFEKHSEKNILDDSLKSIFTKMYSDCVSQCKEVNVQMEEIYTKYNIERNMERKVKPLSVNDKIGKDSVVDVYNIFDGVYQATLSYDSENGIGSAQNYFIVDSQIAKKCRPEIIELMEERDGRFVVENKNNEPYILKELISKNLMPPRDESFIQKLDEFIEKHPEKYAKLYPISSFNFSEKLNELANIDKELTKNPLLCGKKLISLVNEGDKKSISSFLKRNGCIDDSSMKKVFSEWMKTPQMEKAEQIKIKKNDGYPPRGA